MEIILLEKVGKLGGLGDQVTVRDGYARNFLLPQKKALRATNDNKKFFETQRATLEAENAAKRQKADADAKKFENVVVTLIRQASEDGRLFGSVAPRDMMIALNAMGHQITLSMVELLAPIRTTGVTSVRLRLHPEVMLNILVNIARTDAEAASALKAHKDSSNKKNASTATEEAYEAIVDIIEELAEEDSADSDA
jgi:large subunit ribosomal protein L9